MDTFTPEEQAQIDAITKGQPVPQSNAGDLKAGATGLRGGLEMLAGAGGDLWQWEVRKAAQIAKMMGADDATVQNILSYNGQNPTHGPPVIDTPAVQGATDAAVQALPESVSGPIQDVTRHQAQNASERGMETLGGFLPAAVAPGGAAARVARVAIPTLATEGAGAVAKAIAPEYEGPARMVAALLSGTITEGAISGFRMRSAMRQVQSSPEAVAKVKQLLIEQGMSEADAAAKMRELGPDAMRLDTGSQVRQEAQRIQARGGEGRGMLDKPLRERNERMNEMLEGDVEAAVGPRQQPSAVLEALEDRMTRAAKDQRTAHAAQKAPAELQSIVDEIDGLLTSEKDPGTRSMLTKIRGMMYENEPPGMGHNGGPPLETGSKPVLSIRHAIKGMRYNADGSQKELGPYQAQVLDDLYAKVNEALDPANPTLRKADADIEQVHKEKEAFKGGQEIYENPRGAPTEVEFKQAYDAMTPGEQARIADGLNVETYRQLGINANDLTSLKKIMKGEGKWNQQKVAAVIGDDKAKALMDAISNKAVFQESYQKIVQGPKTAETVSGEEGSTLGSAVREAVPDILQGYGTAGTTGASVAGLNAVRRFIMDRLTSGGSGSAKLDADVARLLASNRPDDLATAARLLQEADPGVRQAARSFRPKLSGAPSAVTSALLARQHDLSNRKDQR